MTTPANMVALMIDQAAAGNPVTLTITQPANGSVIANNSTSEAITGVASSTAGNITALTYSIDGATPVAFTFTPAGTVNYSGGNAGLLGNGTHTILVRATDALGNTLSVLTTYSISAASPPAYSWFPSNVYSGHPIYLQIVSSTPGAAVTMTQNQLDVNGGSVGSGGPTALGTTDGAGNFTFVGSASWNTHAYSDTVNTYVGGVLELTTVFYNISTSPNYTYTPSVAPSGTSITLTISGAQGSAPVYQVSTFSPSGIVQTQALGSTDSIGNFSFVGTTSWGSDTSCSVAVHVGLASGAPTVATFTFTP